MSKALVVFILLISISTQAQKPKRPAAEETFNPDVAPIDLVEIRDHIKSLENKIALYKILASGVIKYAGLIVASMGAIDLANVVYASQADIYVVKKATLMDRGAVGLGMQMAKQGGRVGGLIQAPTRVFNKFNEWGIIALDRGTNLLIINSKIVSGGFALAGISWFFVSWEYIPYLIKYNQVELNMLKSLEASIATEQENLTQH